MTTPWIRNHPDALELVADSIFSVNETEGYHRGETMDALFGCVRIVARPTISPYGGGQIGVNLYYASKDGVPMVAAEIRLFSETPTREEAEEIASELLSRVFGGAGMAHLE